MSESSTSGIDPSDVLGGAMFVVGAAILLRIGNAPEPIQSPIVGVVVMVLGIGAVFGRGTFVELVKELLLSTAKKDGESGSGDETSGSDGDDTSGSDDGETDDGEVGIDRPPGDEVTASK